MDLTSCIAVTGMIIVAVRIAAAGEETLGPEDAMGDLTGRTRNTFYAISIVVPSSCAVQTSVVCKENYKVFPCDEGLQTGPTGSNIIPSQRHYPRCAAQLQPSISTAEITTTAWLL